MPIATQTALTATEELRVQKFTAGMDDETTSAMFHLFGHTKPGCDEAAYEFMEVAHGHAPRVSESTISTFVPFDLVMPDGTISKPIRTAVQDAVRQGLLIMRGPKKPTLEPDPRYLSYE